MGSLHFVIKMEEAHGALSRVDLQKSRLCFSSAQHRIVYCRELAYGKFISCVHVQAHQSRSLRTSNRCTNLCSYFCWNEYMGSFIWSWQQLWAGDLYHWSSFTNKETTSKQNEAPFLKLILMSRRAWAQHRSLNSTVSKFAAVFMVPGPLKGVTHQQEAVTLWSQTIVHILWCVAQKAHSFNNRWYEVLIWNSFSKHLTCTGSINGCLKCLLVFILY